MKWQASGYVIKPPDPIVPNPLAGAFHPLLSSLTSLKIHSINNYIKMYNVLTYLILAVVNK